MIFFHQAIRHEKLNKAHSPCEPSHDYNMAECVETSIFTEVGCQPPWRRFSVEGLPLCDSWYLFSEYNRTYYRIYVMDKNELIQYTNCMLPCSFMEYKVYATKYKSENNEKIIMNSF